MEQREVVVITGASAGVGRATAREFARHGARLGLIARGAERVERAREEVEQLGGEALALPGDVADAARLEQIAEEVEDRFGPIDVWINNAMLSVFSPVSEMRPEEYQRVTDVTYLGVVHGTLAVLRRMRPRDRGTIVQVGSALAYRCDAALIVPPHPRYAWDPAPASSKSSSTSSPWTKVQGQERPWPWARRAASPCRSNTAD